MVMKTVVISLRLINILWPIDNNQVLLQIMGHGISQRTKEKFLEPPVSGCPHDHQIIFLGLILNRLHPRVRGHDLDRDIKPIIPGRKPRLYSLFRCSQTFHRFSRLQKTKQLQTMLAYGVKRRHQWINNLQLVHIDNRNQNTLRMEITKETNHHHRTADIVGDDFQHILKVARLSFQRIPKKDGMGHIIFNRSHKAGGDTGVGHQFGGQRIAHTGHLLLLRLKQPWWYGLPWTLYPNRHGQGMTIMGKYGSKTGKPGHRFMMGRPKDEVRGVVGELPKHCIVIVNRSPRMPMLVTLPDPL